MITHDLKAVSCGCELYVCWSLLPPPPPPTKKKKKKKERKERERRERCLLWLNDGMRLFISSHLACSMVCIQ